MRGKSWVYSEDSDCWGNYRGMSMEILFCVVCGQEKPSFVKAMLLRSNQSPNYCPFCHCDTLSEHKIISSEKQIGRSVIGRPKENQQHKNNKEEERQKAIL